MKLIVGGNFDATGSPSRIVSALAEETGWECINGGTLAQLRQIDFSKLSVVLWMPNISNEEEKILPGIKKSNPKLILIQSKRVVEKEYTEHDIISRLFASHSVLGIMITKPDKYNFKLLDPLGNQYADTPSIKVLANALTERVNALLAMTRIGSEQIGPAIKASIEPEFIDIIRSYGNQFARFVNAVNPSRLLGNASTRGEQDRIYVSKRNVDKTTFSADDFVTVLPDVDRVRYFGNNKPSVDTPIQIRLFNYYRNIKYIVHGHVYLETPYMTRSKIPCGYIEEFDEIADLVPQDERNFSVNLKGHGCLILATDLTYFKDQKLIGRPFPEK